MFVRKSMQPVSSGRLGASLMTRDVACGMYPPGSPAYASWGCGPAPAPAPVQAQGPPQLPPTYYATPAPAPVQNIVQVDNAASLRADAEYNARLAADMNAAQAAKDKAFAESAAALSKAEADKLRAQAAQASNQTGYEPGNATYSNQSTMKTTEGGTGAGDSSNGLLLLFGAGALLLVLSKKKRGRK